MNTRQGSSTGLNTVNYVIFLNISDSAVSACEELPGSQIQSDRSSPPPALLRDGEDLLNIAPNNAGVEGGFCRVGAEGPPGLRGARGRQGTPLWGNCVCEQAPSSVM